MKKVLFALAFVSFALVSCQKERTCNCTDSDGDKFSYTIAKAKKSDQEKVCDTWGMSSTVTCELD
jgi:hypothetical protein